MLRIFSLLLTLTTFISLQAQSFEGVVEFKKKTKTDTVNYIYYVKGDKVRIDEIGKKSKKVEGSFIVDLKTQTTQFISHERKVWGIQDKGTPNKAGGKCETVTTKTTKTIQGYKCTEYVVTNTEENTIIKYYCTKSKFDFFLPLVTSLNRRDKFSLYFQKIPEAGELFPMLSILTAMDGTEKEKMEIIKIEKKTIDDKSFEIPSDYQKFEK